MQFSVRAHGGPSPKATVASTMGRRAPPQADVRNNDRVPGRTAGKEALMFRDAETFSSFAVPDIEAARRFYGDTLGLEVTNSAEEGLIELHVGGGAPVLVYPKPDHKPAVFTVLNFVVPDIDASVRELNAAGVELQRYDLGGGAEPDGLGIYRGQGPSIGWFTDPAGNILSVLERPTGQSCPWPALSPLRRARRSSAAECERVARLVAVGDRVPCLEPAGSRRRDGLLAREDHRDQVLRRAIDRA